MKQVEYAQEVDDVTTFFFLLYFLLVKEALFVDTECIGDETKPFDGIKIFKSVQLKGDGLLISLNQCAEYTQEEINMSLRCIEYL